MTESSNKVPVAAAAAFPSSSSSSTTTPVGTNATTAAASSTTTRREAETLCRSILRLHKDDQIEEGAAVGCLLSLTRTLYLGTGGVCTTTMERRSREEISTVETPTTKKRKNDDGGCGVGGSGGGSAAIRRCRRYDDDDDNHNGGKERTLSSSSKAVAYDLVGTTLSEKAKSKNLVGTSFAKAVDRSETDEDQSTVLFFTLTEKDIRKNLVGTIVTRDWQVDEDVMPFTGRVVSGPTKTSKGEPSTWRVIYPDGDSEDIGYDELVNTIKKNFMSYWEPHCGNNYDAWPALPGLLDLYADGQNTEPLTKGQRVIITEHFSQLQSLNHPLPQPNNGDDEEDLSISQVPKTHTLNDKDIL
eukprot:CAMPEP_0113494004 /NCGR_PEP_ID=MMETSP0014_2-20120614/28884_1 /TAXON_ID=2857 /ORGANISM="Nitzschia sp." /LENGTH=356 /DNA_ID=CAMNT_0000387885 /DNA_START=242 /DNA_END=1312 /DNA_ORIENTATION=- /assembly_acc=CAM_ASM_000159